MKVAKKQLQKKKNKQIHSSKKVKSKNRKGSQIRKGKGSFKKERKKDQQSLMNKEMMYKNQTLKNTQLNTSH